MITNPLLNNTSLIQHPVHNHPFILPPSMAVSSSSNDIPSCLLMDFGSNYEAGSSTEDAIMVHLDSESTKAWL